VRTVNNIPGFFAISPDVLVCIHLPPGLAGFRVAFGQRVVRHQATH
jgi:hypothetical protein